MSASNERLGDEARQRALQEIIAEEEQRLGAFVLPRAVTLETEQNWNDVRWSTPNIREPKI